MINQIRKCIGGTSLELATSVRQNTLNVQPWSKSFAPQPVAVPIAHARKMLHNYAGMSKKRGTQIAKGRQRKINACRTEAGQRAIDRAFHVSMDTFTKMDLNPDDFVFLPEGNHLWTCFLPDFRMAQGTALLGHFRLWSETPTARAFSGTNGQLEGPLAMLRGGIITSEDPMLKEAERLAKSKEIKNFCRQIGNAVTDRYQRNAKLFHLDGQTVEMDPTKGEMPIVALTLCTWWVCELLWMANSESIASYLVTRGITEQCDVSTVNKLIKHLELHRYQGPGKVELTSKGPQLNEELLAEKRTVVMEASIKFGVDLRCRYLI